MQIKSHDIWLKLIILYRALNGLKVRSELLSTDQQSWHWYFCTRHSKVWKSDQNCSALISNPDADQCWLRVLWVDEETRLLPRILRIFSVVLTLNFAFLPRKLMVSHVQGFCSLCLAFVVFRQHFHSWDYKVLLTVWTIWWWHGFSLKKVITG